MKVLWYLTMNLQNAGTADFSYDNKGQDSTGRNQAALGVGIDNIFGLNDLLNLS